jgi:hypothetical protein
VARRWTSADDACLRRSYTSGEPVAEIARALARSTDAVVARRALLGIAPRRVPRPWPEPEDRLLRSAVETGVPATALAGRLERSVHQIRARTRQLGLAMRTARGYTPTEDSMLSPCGQAATASRISPTAWDAARTRCVSVPGRSAYTVPRFGAGEPPWRT